MTLTEYLNKAEDYLKSKLPDVPEHTVHEAAAYLTNLAYIATQDEVNNAREQMMRDFRRYERRTYLITKKRGVTNA